MLFVAAAATDALFSSSAVLCAMTEFLFLLQAFFWPVLHPSPSLLDHLFLLLESTSHLIAILINSRDQYCSNIITSSLCFPNCSSQFILSISWQQVGLNNFPDLIQSCLTVTDCFLQVASCCLPRANNRRPYWLQCPFSRPGLYSSFISLTFLASAVSFLYLSRS